MTEIKKSGKKIIAVIQILLVISTAVCALFIVSGCSSGNSEKDETTVETQAPTEFSVTPADDKEIESFSKNVIGTWQSYTEKGKAYTYTFNKDGSLLFKQDGMADQKYTYSFKDGLLTVKNSKHTHVYQCSRDAVGMMARLHNGEWQNDFVTMAEKIDNFGGCVYIEDDIMYMGEKCLCRDSSIKKFDGKSIEGDWVGAVGDTVNFAADGSYTYVKNADKYSGKYAVDFKKYTLDITIGQRSNHHDKDSWGISGRILHIGKQYYFKLS